MTSPFVALVAPLLPLIAGGDGAITGTRTASTFEQATDGGICPGLCTWTVRRKHL